MASYPWRKAVGLLAKLAVSAAIGWLLCSRADLSGVRHALAGASMGRLGLAVAAFLLLPLMGGLRWWLVLRGIGERPRLPDLVIVFSAASVVGQLLPSVVGDGMRVWLVGRGGGGMRPAWQSVLLERVVMVLALLALGFATAPMLAARTGFAAQLWLSAALFAAGLAGLAALLVADRALSWLCRLGLPARIGSRLAAPGRSLAELTRASRRLVLSRSFGYVAAVSLIANLVFALDGFLLGRALFAGASLWDMIAIMPAVTLATTLPISFGGWGVREGVLVLLLGRIGVPTAEALALSLLFGLLGIAAGLPGLLAWLLVRGRDTSPVMPADARRPEESRPCQARARGPAWSIIRRMTSFRAKRALDFWLGGLLLLVLFLPVRGLGLLLRRNHSTAQRRGCAVIKMVGAGSLFLATPSLQAIRGRFPAGQFFLVGTGAVTGFAKDFGWFDKCWTLDDSNPWRLVVSTLRALVNIAWHCDHLIDLEVHSRLTTVFGLLTLVRNRIGFVDEIVFWRRGFYTHMTCFNTQGPVYAFYDMLAAWFGIGLVPVTAVHAAFRARVQAQVLPQSLKLPARYVAIGPGCSEFGRERQLYPEEWRDLLAGVAGDGIGVVLLGAPTDRALCGAVAAAIGHGHNLAGQLNMAQSAVVLANAERYFGIDSVLLHLARALGVPAASVWGPTDPATRLRHGASEDRIYYRRLCCSPCIHVHEMPPCKGARPCIPAALAAAPCAVGVNTGALIGWAAGPGERTPHAVEVAVE